MKRICTLLTLLLVLCIGVHAQIVTTSPLIIQETSSDIILTYNAASPLGNNGLVGLPSSTAVYAHIGVITNKSTGNSDWKYAPSWVDNAAKYKLTYVSPNTYTLKIPNLRTYFGITNSDETIKKIAMVFRTADCSKEGKTKAGGDIFVDVYPEGYQMIIQSDAPGTVVNSPCQIKLTAAATQTSTITISVNGTNIASKSKVTELTGTYNIASTGSYTFKATATNGTQTLSRSFEIAYPAASSAGIYPGGVPKMGTVKNSDGSVTFCLAAPEKKSVVMVPSWDNYQVLERNTMQYQDYGGQRYFFITVSGLRDDVWYPYYYIVDGSVKVADPYANLVLDCYSDKWIDPTVWPDMPKYPYDRFDDVMLAVYRGDLNGTYKFSDFEIPDHRNLIVYEMLFRDFTGTDGKADANGTVRKAIEKIPYLKSLGINAVELMPIMQFNGNNSWGYNPNFYMAPDKNYGSPTDYRDFIETCHQNGIAVILDVAFNHVDGLNPWYMMYPPEHNPFFNATAPHDYSVLNDWNQKNPLVQQQFHDAVQYWMREYDVDGFRFDLVKGMGTDYPSGTEAYNPTRVATMKALQEAIAEVKPNGIHINENLAGTQEENEMFADGGQLNWANINNSSCQYAMGYAENAGLGRFLSSADGGRTAFSTISYAESHDEQRVPYKQITYGAEQVKNSREVQFNRLQQLAAQMFLTPGAKMLWQFEELGDAQNTKNENGSNNTDPKIVPWGTLEDENVSNLHDVYAALINLRTGNNDLFTDGTYWQSGVNANSLTTNRLQIISKDKKQILVMTNPSLSGIKNITVGQSRCEQITPESYQLICATPGYTPVLTKSGNNLNCTIPANYFALFASKDVTAVEDISNDLNENPIRVYADGGRIVIEGNYDNAKVYNLEGQLCNSYSVPAGLYIVVVDNHPYKIAVR